MLCIQYYIITNDRKSDIAAISLDRIKYTQTKKENSPLSLL